jgi:hypothetical protein
MKTNFGDAGYRSMQRWFGIIEWVGERAPEPIAVLFGWLMAIPTVLFWIICVPVACSVDYILGGK